MTVHRFIIAAISVGSKALSDAFCTNGRYARVGGISVVEMNLLEKEFCEALDWRLTVRISLRFPCPYCPGPCPLTLSRNRRLSKDFRSGPCTLLHVTRPLPCLVPIVDRTGTFTSSASRTRQDSRPVTHLDFDLDSAVPAKAQLESTATAATTSRTTPKRDGR